MFTGIVEERARVRSGGPVLEVEAEAVVSDAEIGDSIAVNGVCLTVAGRADGTLRFDLADETLERTTLGNLEAGSAVNLERPVTLLTRLGGHLVQGHVDAVGTVEDVAETETGKTVRIALPPALRPYLVEKGSVAVDGVSLTVASLDDDTITVALIPHTLAVTTLGEARAGTRVNLEVDVLAKYVENLLGRRR